MAQQKGSIHLSHQTLPLFVAVATSTTLGKPAATVTPSSTMTSSPEATSRTGAPRSIVPVAKA